MVHTACLASLQWHRKGGRPAPGVTILGWHHIMMWNHNSTDLWWIPYFFYFVWLSSSSFGLKNLLIFRRRPSFFFGLNILLDRKNTYFSVKTFFFGLHLLFLVRKRVPPRNPPGATILSNASASLPMRYRPSLPSWPIYSTQDLNSWNCVGWFLTLSSRSLISPSCLPTRRLFALQIACW